MLRCGQDWKPNEIFRFVQGFPTSTRVMQVVTDEGNAFLKAELARALAPAYPNPGDLEQAARAAVDLAKRYAFVFIGLGLTSVIMNNKGRLGFR